MRDCGNRMSGCLSAICAGCWLIAFTSASHSSCFSEFAASLQWWPWLLVLCAGMLVLMPKSIGRRRKRKDLHRTGGISCSQIPRGYTGRKLDLEGTKAGCMMSFIIVNWWREEGYHSLRRTVNAAELLCNMTTGCRSHKPKQGRVQDVGGGNQLSSTMCGPVSGSLPQR